MSFLMGLNDSYSQVRGQLLLMDSFPPINKVFSLVSQEERQRTVGSHFTHNADSNTHNMALAVKNESSHRLASHVPNRSGHNSTHQSATGNVNRYPSHGRPFCTHCNYLGHTVETCYKLHGYPPGYRQRQKSTSPTHQNTHVNQILAMMKLLIMLMLIQWLAIFFRI